VEAHRAATGGAAGRLLAELCPKGLGAAGGMTLRQIADRLNEEGWTTPRKKEWNGLYVCRFLKQCEEANG
jgi:hypothetical protein